MGLLLCTHYFDLFVMMQATFQRYPRPEKEYQSFSLLYNDRSLDLVRALSALLLSIL